MTGYLTKHERIAIPGVADLHLRSLLDRRQFDDPDDAALRQGISSAMWPLFGLLWPSGRHLAERMANRPVTDGERILEIGCGLGLASLVSHRRGADITASDCHPLTAGFLAENLRLNDLPPMKYRHGHWADMTLDAAPVGAQDQRHVEGRFELIIGSDVLYERDDDSMLAGFIGRHGAPLGQVWVIDPNRGNRAAFTRKMSSMGYVLTEEMLHRAAVAPDVAYRGRLLMYQGGP
jgi:predicted nicotinamide N-methyase